MLIIHSVSMRNFLSVGAVTQTVTLADRPLTLIMGDNGAGKTTMLQAISYALFGEPLTNIKKDNLVNLLNERDMMVSLNFSRDGVPYRIERGRKPNVLRFLVGPEQEDMALGDSRQTQITIDKMLGMSHTMFCHIVALSTFTVPFLRLRAVEQREIVEELMGITQLSELADELKALIDQHKEVVRDQESMVKAITDSNDRIEKSIVRMRHDSQQWDTEQQSIIADLAAKAERLDAVDVDRELLVFDAIDEWKQLRREQDQQIAQLGADIQATDTAILRLRQERSRLLVANGISVQSSSLRQQAADLRRQAEKSVQPELQRLAAMAKRQHDNAERLAVQRAEIEARQNDIQAQLDNADAHTCTTCGQGLSGTDHLQSVIARLTAQRVDLQNQMSAATVGIEQALAAADAYDAESTALVQEHQIRCTEALSKAAEFDAAADDADRQAAERRAETEAQMRGIDEDIELLVRQKEETQRALVELPDIGPSPQSAWSSRDSLWKLRQERDNLYAKLSVELERTNPFQSKIDALAATLAEIDYSILKDVTLKMKHEQFLFKLLTSKDSFIRKRIVDQNLGFLNKTLNRYLRDIGLAHEVKFQPDMTVEITNNGRDYDFEMMSRGEMNRVILATSWAFRDLWENLNFPVSLVFLDECLDQGTDRDGVASAAQMLNNMATARDKNIFLVSHREDLREQMDQVLMVTKEDAFSAFEMLG